MNRSLVALALVWWLTVVIDQPNWKASWLAQFLTEIACREAQVWTLNAYPGVQTTCEES